MSWCFSAFWHTSSVRMDAVHRRAEQQHGVLGVTEAQSLGLTRSAQRHAIAQRRLELVTGRVLRIPGAPVSDRQQVMVAVLDAQPGAHAYASTGACLWGVPGHRLLPAHVVRTVGRSGRRSAQGVVHEVAGLGDDHVTLVDGIPVVRPEVVVLYFCGATYRQRAESVLENLWRRRLVSGRSLRSTLDALACSGRRGVVVMRELLDERGRDYVPPASNLERRFASILARAGVAPMRRQVDSGGDEWVGRVDFRDDNRPLIVEVQSETFHSALVDQRRDATRLAALRAAGFEVVEVTDEQVWYRPAEVVSAVQHARRRLDRSHDPVPT
jgi:very-short-patch-repair endonuclease